MWADAANRARRFPRRSSDTDDTRYVPPGPVVIRPLNGGRGPGFWTPGRAGFVIVLTVALTSVGLIRYMAPEMRFLQSVPSLPIATPASEATEQPLGGPTAGDQGTISTPAATVDPNAGAPSSSPAVAAAAVGTSTAHPRFSIAVAAFNSSAQATDLVQTLSASAPGHVFYSAPIEVAGQVYYRVLGGLAADRSELGELRASIAAATGRNGSDWLFRETALAFLLGDYATLPEATARTVDLRTADIPAYTLAVDREDGTVGYRVYAGGYANETEAARLRTVLTDSGILSPRLVERRGRIAG